MILAAVPQLYRLDRLKLSHLHYPEHQIRFQLDEWTSIVRQGGGVAIISEIRGIGYYTSCLPYLPMLSPWYCDDNGHRKLFRYLRGTVFEWEPLKRAVIFLTSLLRRIQGWCNLSLLVLQRSQQEKRGKEQP